MLKVPVIENSVCQEMFQTAGHSKKILPSFLCAGYANGQKDSCEVSILCINNYNSRVLNSCCRLKANFNKFILKISFRGMQVENFYQSSNTHSEKTFRNTGVAVIARNKP